MVEIQVHTLYVGVKLSMHASPGVLSIQGFVDALDCSLSPKEKKIQFVNLHMNKCAI